MSWLFGDCELDAATYELRRAGAVQHLEPQAFDVLAYLVQHRDRVVSKQELLRAVWGDRVVSESALTTRIKEVRRTIGDDGRNQSMIRTLHGRGYRFVAEVRGPTEDSFAGREARSVRVDRYVVDHCTTADGVRLAYAAVGSGPVVVQDTTPLTDLASGWDNAGSRDWFELLRKSRRVVRYDVRGSGLSQHAVPPITVDDLLCDLRTVVDAAGIERFSLVSHSLHAMVAARFAAENPTRVERLVLCGCPLAGPLAPDAPAAQRAEYELNVELFSQGWGNDRGRLRRMVASALMPGATDAVVEEFASVRHLGTVERLAEFLRVVATIDLTDVAARLSMPTMLLHSLGDTMVPFTRAEALAERIPDVRLVALPGSSHLLQSTDPAWPSVVSCVDEFLRG